jgi:DNA-binding response OmpR family regulator
MQNVAMNILLIEDEQRIADLIVNDFESAGFEIHHETDGFRGLNTALIKNFDAIVLDVALPLMDGFQVLAEIRRKGLSTPVIMLTAKTDLSDRLNGFALGADDYLAKPFFIEELIVRLKTLVARKSGSVASTIVQSGLTLDRFARLATWGLRTSALTQREYVLLECLMLSPGQIFSRQQILRQVWNVDFDPGTNVVDVCIQRLRKKLADANPDSTNVFPIETIRGVGYRLNNA